MSQTAITLAFEQWKAQQAATGEPVLLDEFVFALVPGLDPDFPVDRSETLPPAVQIVHRESVTRKGVVNENAVVHSAVLGADVGDFSFNWIGLTNKATGTLAMIVHAPEQQKLKTKEGQQGNVLTRSFVMEFAGAQAETAINTPAETWQIDFTARMAGMDERQRLENIDLYGAGAFFDDGYLVGKTGTQYFVTKGTGYVAGLRAAVATNQNIIVTTKPVKVWLDVSWNGTLTSEWATKSNIVVAADLADYIQDGMQHYVFALAEIDVSGNITDLRPKNSLSDQSLAAHEKSRNHPDATTTEKGFTKLSSALDSNSEQLAATPKAVKAANDNANGRVPTGRRINGHELTSDVNVTSQDIFSNQAIEIGANANLDGYGGPGIYYQTANVNADVTLNYPEKAAGSLIVLKNAGITQIYYVYNSSKVYVRSKYAEERWTVWALTYNTEHKPSPSDIGAVNKSGDTMPGELKISDTNGLRLFNGEYGVIFRRSENALHIIPTLKGQAENGDIGPLRPLTISLDTGNVSFGQSITVGDSIRVGTPGNARINVGDDDSGLGCSADGQIDMYSNGRAVGYWNGGIFAYNGRIVPSDFYDFDRRYPLKDAISGIGLEADNPIAPYMRRESTGGLVYLATADWARRSFVQDVSLGAQVIIGTQYAPAGCCVTYVDGGDSSDGIGYKPIQIFINNAWRTITG